MGGEFDAYYTRAYLPVWVMGTIVDVETRGLDPDESNMTAIGFIKGNKLSVFVITADYETEKQEEFREWAYLKLLRSQRPYIAYYNDFESAWLRVRFDIELQPKAYLKKAEAVNFWHFVNTSNSDMINADESEIAYHLVCDMLEELALYVSLANRFRSRELNLMVDVRKSIEWIKEDSE